VQDCDFQTAILDLYSAWVCRQVEFWNWASAEPAVARWGALQ
jgi:hypothetical protein